MWCCECKGKRGKRILLQETPWVSFPTFPPEPLCSSVILDKWIVPREHCSRQFPDTIKCFESYTKPWQLSSENNVAIVFHNDNFSLSKTLSSISSPKPHTFINQLTTSLAHPAKPTRNGNLPIYPFVYTHPSHHNHARPTRIPTSPKWHRPPPSNYTSSPPRRHQRPPRLPPHRPLWLLQRQQLPPAAIRPRPRVYIPAAPHAARINRTAEENWEVWCVWGEFEGRCRGKVLIDMWRNKRERER